MSFLRMLWVFSIRARFGLFRHNSPVALLKVSAHRVFGRQVLLLPILTPHTDVACAHLPWSILVTWPPHFHSNCEPLTRCPSCWFFVFSIRHSAAPYSLQYSPFHVPPLLKLVGVKQMAFILILRLHIIGMYVGKYLRGGKIVFVNRHYIIHLCQRKILWISVHLCVYFCC